MIDYGTIIKLAKIEADVVKEYFAMCEEDGWEELDDDENIIAYELISQLYNVTDKSKISDIDGEEIKRYLIVGTAYEWCLWTRKQIEVIEKIIDEVITYAEVDD
jgi:hypothetical protein